MNAVHPTGVGTPLTDNAVVDEYFARNADLAAQIERVFAPVEPGAISDAVLFLASDASRHIPLTV